MALEDIVSKRADAAYASGNRGLWLKVKCLHREEFVVVGWTDPKGRRPWLGALLLAYYDPDGTLVCAGRAGTSINTPELERSKDGVGGWAAASVRGTGRRTEAEGSVLHKLSSLRSRRCLRTQLEHAAGLMRDDGPGTSSRRGWKFA